MARAGNLAEAAEPEWVLTGGDFVWLTEGSESPCCQEAPKSPKMERQLVTKALWTVLSMPGVGVLIFLFISCVLSLLSVSRIEEPVCPPGPLT